MGRFLNALSKAIGSASKNTKNSDLTRYRSIDEMGLKPHYLRYKIYRKIVAGKNYDEIYGELLNEGEFQNRRKYEAIEYIQYFHGTMER